MAQAKNKLLMLVGAGILLVAIVVMAALLFFEAGKLGKVRNSQEALKTQLSNAYAGDPFPEQKNAEAMQANCSELERETRKLAMRMGRGQVAPQEGASPLEWRRRLSVMKKELEGIAAERGITLPGNFWYGFVKYSEGQPPRRADVSRLSRQLIVVDSLCRMLFDTAGVQELTSVQRDVFEGGTGGARPTGRGRSRSRSRAQPVGRTAGAEGETAGESDWSSLYEKESFTFQFKSKEGGFLACLNKLANNDMFIIVRKVTVKATSGVDVESLYTSEGGRDTDGIESLVKVDDTRPRDERVVCGQIKETPASIGLILDVYWFGLKKKQKPGAAGVTTP